MIYMIMVSLVWLVDSFKYATLVVKDVKIQVRRKADGNVPRIHTLLIVAISFAMTLSI